MLWETEAEFFSNVNNNPILSLLSENKIEIKQQIIDYNFLDVYLTVMDKLKEIQSLISRNK